MKMRLYAFKWKPRMRQVLCLLMLALLSPSSASFAEELPVSRFSTEGLSGWEPRSFKGITEYRLEKEAGPPLADPPSTLAALRPAQGAALAKLCLALFNLNEFSYVD